MLLRRPSPLLLGLALTLAPTLATAEEKNPAVEACVGKAEGDPCTSVRMIKGNEGKPETRESPGTCQTDECCEVDYSKGSPPETKCGPCLACKPGGPLPTPDGPDVSGDSPASGGGGDGAAAGDGAGGDGPPTTQPNDKRGCSVGGAPAPWSALLVLTLLWRRRRRD